MKRLLCWLRHESLRAKVREAVVLGMVEGEKRGKQSNEALIRELLAQNAAMARRVG